MHLAFPITLFAPCVSALVLGPLITPAPQVAKREDAENICGYYSLSGLSIFLGTLVIFSQG